MTTRTGRTQAWGYQQNVANESWDAYPQLSKCELKQCQAYNLPYQARQIGMWQFMEQKTKPVNSLHVVVFARTCCPQGSKLAKPIKAEPEGIYTMLCLRGLYTWYSASILQVMSSSKNRVPHSITIHCLINIFPYLYSLLTHINTY